MMLGEKILMLRKARGMSQEQLAQSLEVSRQAVSKWELNEAVPDVSRVVAMSELFGVTTDYLLKPESGETGYPHDVDNEKTGDVMQNSAMQPDRKWLGAVLVGVCALAIFGIWAIVEIEDHYYSWSGGFNYSDDGLVGYLLFNQGMIPVLLLLVYGVIGGIRILLGKPFLLTVLTRKFWSKKIDDWSEHSGEILSEETKEFLGIKDDDSDK